MDRLSVFMQSGHEYVITGPPAKKALETLEELNSARITVERKVDTIVLVPKYIESYSFKTIE